MTHRDLKIVCVGDLALVGRYHRQLARSLARSPLREVALRWESADLRTGNLECALTKAPRARASKLVLRGAPQTPQVLAAAKLDVVSLANNHLMDFGGSGVVETCERLAAAKIRYVGAGRNSLESARPVVVTCGDQRVGFLAWCDVIQHSPLYADALNPGVARWDPAAAREAISALRPHIDFLVVHLHWGVEFTRFPAPAQRQTAIELTNAGVDLIIGHHPHVLQGAEVIGRTAVLYSLGNFAFSPLLWRGVNSRGEHFVAPNRLHPMSCATGWVEVTLSSAAPPGIKFVPARLGGDLCLRVEDTADRHRDWSDLTARLLSCPTAEAWQEESRKADVRKRWCGKPQSWAERIRLRLIQRRLWPTRDIAT